MKDSIFVGGLGDWVFRLIISAILSGLTLGIAYPWLLCWQFGWKINNTIIEGRRLKFIGTGSGLIGLWIKILLLCIITLGIYGFWGSIALEKWRVKNTVFDVEDSPPQLR